MKIILDFDDTIFNTHFLMRKIMAVFEKVGFTEEEFWNAYRGCKKKLGDFDSEIIISLLSETKTFNKIKVEKEIDLVIENSKDFVYPDFFDFVNNFNKKDLILLSFGSADFQGMKIKNSGITSYFQEVIITQKDKVDNLKNILQPFNKLRVNLARDDKNEGEKIFFIDDKAEQIDKIKKELPQITTMKMERPQGGHLNIKSKLTDYVVKNLDEASIYI